MSAEEKGEVKEEDGGGGGVIEDDERGEKRAQGRGKRVHLTELVQGAGSGGAGNIVKPATAQFIGSIFPNRPNALHSE
jgi:hypothetical protein